MRFLFIVLFMISFSSFAADETRIWKKCRKDSECKIDHRRACGTFCYNKKYEKEAFEWESRIVWECIPPNGKARFSRCVNHECSCEEKK